MKTPGRRSMVIAAAVVVLGAIGAIIGIVSYHAGFVNGAGDGVRNVRVAPFFGRGFGEIQVVRDRFPGGAVAAVLLALAAVLIIAAIVTGLSRRSAARTIDGGDAAVAGVAAGGGVAAASLARGDALPRATFDEWHRRAHEAPAQPAAGQPAAPAGAEQNAESAVTLESPTPAQPPATPAATAPALGETPAEPKKPRGKSKPAGDA